MVRLKKYPYISFIPISITGQRVCVSVFVVYILGKMIFWEEGGGVIISVEDYDI